MIAGLPPAVTDAVALIHGAGADVYVVGGAVRDWLIGRPIRDWDLATSLEPSDLAGLFPSGVDRDLRYGAMRLPADDGDVVVTCFREESGYQDRRHPDQVVFTDDPAVDGRRRDFTCNAIYVNARTATVIDPFGGQDDLRRGVLRTIGDPLVRFDEDPLRMLRGVRFAARCGLELEGATAAAVTASAGLLVHLSAERIYQELTASFTGHGRGRALRLMIDSGLAAVVLPEVVPMDGVQQPPQYHPEGDVLTHVCMVLDEVADGDAVQAWCAVLHDIGKPETFDDSGDRIRFSGHDQLSAEMARVALERLRAPRGLIEVVEDVCRDHIRIASLLQMRPAKRERWMRTANFLAHLEFHGADCRGSHGDLSIYHEARRLLSELPPPPARPLCQGADVLNLGVPPGPLVGEILRQLQRELDELERPDREAALSLLETIVRQQIKEP